MFITISVFLKPPILLIENKIIPIDTVIKIGEYCVRNKLPPRGNKNPIKEKHAGHTPNINPNVVPPNPVLTSFLQSMHLFFAKRHSAINIPKRPENTMYGMELSGFWIMSVNHI